MEDGKCIQAGIKVDPPWIGEKNSFQTLSAGDHINVGKYFT
jgi:hypothetical protein